MRAPGGTLLALMFVAVTACRGDGEDGSWRSGASIGAVRAAGPLDETSLSRAAGGADGLTYTVGEISAPGIVSGRVIGATPRDTTIVPSSDPDVCSPFSESMVASLAGGVGNAAVWLVGVKNGPPDDSPRLVRLVLSGCRLEPRVQRVALGGTVNVNSRDAMTSRLRFTAVGENQRSRAEARFNDAGQVVPTSEPAATPGLVGVSDDLHPWVRAWLLVSPHPFVAVTRADGEFRFDRVPPGRYQLVVWHEHLGVRHTAVRVEANVQARVELEY